MNKITLPDGRRVDDKWAKWLRVLAYALMATAGFFLLLSPFLTDVYNTAAEAMAWFLLIGGVVSAVGCASDRWWGEYIGTPLLISSFSVFAVITFIGTYPELPHLAIGNAALLSSVVAGLASRWRHAQVIYRLAVHMSERNGIPPLEAGEYDD